MNVNLVFSAVSAAIAVTAFSLWGWKSLCILALYIGFLYVIKDRSALYVQLVVIAVSGSIYIVHTERNQTGLHADLRQFSITFTDIPEIDGNSMETIAKTASGEKLMVRRIFNNYKEKRNFEEQYQAGMQCKVTGTLDLPDPARNENSFNYRKYLYYRGIHWMLKVQSLENCKIEQQPNLLYSLKNIRYKGLKLVKKHFSKESQGIAAALLFGEAGFINENILQNYQVLGIIHLLSISGLHVTILAGGLFLLGIRSGITRKKMHVLLFTVLPLYAVLTGLSPPVIRACGMAMIYLCLQLVNIRVSVAQTICLAYIGFAALNPYILFDPGFQLSFSVTSALLFSSKIISRYPTLLLQSFIISCICQVCSLPIMLYHFFEVSIAGLFVNVVFVPLYSFIILPLAILAFSFIWVHAAAAKLLIHFFHIILHTVNGWLDLLSSIPVSSIVFGKPHFIVLVFLTGLILGIFYCWEIKAKITCIVLVFLMTILLCYQYFAEYVTPFGEVTFLDVGQGDSIFIKLPFGRGTYLIDTGGQLQFNRESWEEKSSTFEVGKDIVVPFLKGKGITKLDKLILTHPDADHLGGAPNVLKEISAEQILISQAALKGYKKSLNDIKSSIVAVKGGSAWTTGKESFYILNPQGNPKDTNEASIVILAEIAGKRWLFTGDLGKEGESLLMEKYPGLEADYLKAGHHGSKNSTSGEFLDQVDPASAFISAGENNRYGHPSQEVLNVLKEHNVLIYRTDKDGAITFRFFNRNGTFSEMLP
ncbi:DNA internalization-related competence protein ComEC/Rec2 [Peribacillus deserti]|uniref:DNA internalization-related competence protein ComEC/Rec2 n=1 Tax=Peribacillus deserti TaxID=673318 RepID=A0A2N5M9B5_9BACI|nr:DNA internalization-related competence protein ComEC/Rec2 [Peribacillus deserti]PLT30942.1 DNA internalization-related competence protein ComEC/Rec2 [Peribacillus deserti]